MNKPNMFIASSMRALPFAEQLRKHLMPEDLAARLFEEVVLWSDDFSAGPTITENLRRVAESSDFATVLLTRDDEALVNGEKVWMPRGNCLFEAGLFTGALGIDHQRCFLARADGVRLPSDLLGPLYIPFTERADFDEFVKKEEKPVVDTYCAASMKPVAESVRTAVCRKLPRCYGRPILSLMTENELRDREQLEDSGGHLERGNVVVVNTKQPLEKDHRFALRVRENMRYGVNYQYFFQGDLKAVDGIWTMIQMISLAYLIGDRVGPPDELKKIMETNKTTVENNLDIIQGHLGIHFLSYAPSVHFCVHNAISDKKARSYVRYREEQEQFIELNTGSKAVAVAEGITSQCVDNHPEAVFRKTKYFELYANEPEKMALVKALRDGISTYFPKKLHNKVEEVCFVQGFQTRVA